LLVCPIQGSFRHGATNSIIRSHALRSNLKLLGQALRNEPSSFEGKIHQRFRAANTSDLSGGQPPKLYLGALGAKMLSLAGALADGTIVWMTGPRNHPKLHTPHVGRSCRGRRTADATHRRVHTGDVAPRLPLRAGRPLLSNSGCSRVTVPCSIAKDFPGLRIWRSYGDQETVARRLQEIFDAGSDEIICTEFGTDEDLANTRGCLEVLVNA